MNSVCFWDFKKKIDRESKVNEEITAMKDEEGKIQTDIDKIKEVFEAFYIKLFKPNKKGESEEEKEAERMQEIMFNSICKVGKFNSAGRITIGEEEVERNIKKLKSKSSYDQQGLSTKILHNSGQDAIKSLQLILDEVDKTSTMPKEWTEMIIKSISKGTGMNNDVEKRRGLFITNIISKVYEKIKLERNEERINSGISNYQCGGKRVDQQ